LLELNKIYNMDCMEGMKDMPDKYFELAIVDPPYGIGVGQMNMGGRQTVRPDKSKKWDDAIPSHEYFKELMRVSQNQIIWGGNYFHLPPTRGFVVWDKGESMYRRSFAECEFAWTSFNVSARIYKRSPNDNNRIHPTQKPVALYKWLLENYAKQGDKILDTHLGSGSSIIACYDMGFDYMGFEIDKEYFEEAKKRIERHKAQITIFDIAEEKEAEQQTSFFDIAK
jgi:site-specific DNA-methyltransferase (adenine-specific)